MARGGLATALAISITGLLLTIMKRAREGAFFINGGIIGFLVQYFIILSQLVIDPRLIWVSGFLVVLISSIIFLINVHWLGSREKIVHDLYMKLSKGGSIVILSDSLIIVVYSSYFWWFGNIFSSLGLGLIIIGAILPIFRYLISSRKMIYILSMLPINIGISLMAFWGLYVASLDLYLSFFLICMLGFLINLLINSIFSKVVETGSDTFWNKLFFVDFLSISLSGSLLFFGLFYLQELPRIMIGLLWFTSFSFATNHFAYKGGLLSREKKEALWFIAGFGLTFEISFLISLFVFNATNFLLAFGAFSISCGVLMLLFNFTLNKKFLFYINSANILCGFGVITAGSIYFKFLDLSNAIFWAVFVVNCVLITILRFGLLRKFLVKPIYYKANFFNWFSLSIIVGIIIGWNIYIPEILFFQLFLGLLVGSFMIPLSLVWAEAGGLIGKYWYTRLYRIIGALINLQLANIISLFILQYPDGWIGYIATVFIIFSLLSVFLFIKIEEKLLILLNHILLTLGVFLIIFWIGLVEDYLLNLVLSTWIGLMVFSIILPVCFQIVLASKKTLYRLTFAVFLFYTFLSTWLLNYSLISIDLVTRSYLEIIFVTLLLFLLLYFGKNGEIYSERVFYGLSSINLSVFVVIFSLFGGSLLAIDPFYRITFIFLFLFLLLIPDLYFIFKAKFLKEAYFRRAIEVIEHILSGLFAAILAGIPILISNNWALGFGIFFTVYAFLSGLVHLYYKRYSPFKIYFLIFFGGLFWFLYNILILIVITIITTIFWALLIDLLLVLIVIEIYKYYELITVRGARLSTVYVSLSLSFVFSFLVEFYLLEFPLLAIISAIVLFLLLIRIVILYIDANEIFLEKYRIYLLQFSLWACISTFSLFVYILLNTFNPTPYTLRFQIFNITFASILFTGFSCVFSKAFRDAFIKLITNRIFLTVLSTSMGCLTAVLISFYYENLFLGINLAILIILICWKAIFYKKSFANYFIIGVPVILGVLLYKSIFDFINTYLNPLFFDYLYILFYSIALVAMILFVFSYTLWRFKSNLKFGLIIIATIFFVLPLIYNIYFRTNPLLLTFTGLFLIILPWLISVVLINNLWLSHFFKKESRIFFSISLGGLFFLFILISFNFLFPTLGLNIRFFTSIFTSAGISFFIFSIFARYFNFLTQKNIAITLGVSVFSGAWAIGFMLYFYQGIDPLISIGLAIDFGIFLYYLSLICYLWELSKIIWEKGWFVWIAVPVVNAFLIFLSFLPLGPEFITFGIFLTISIGHILFLPIVFYRWRKNFRLSWFIIWAEMIPLSFSAAYYFWFKEFLATAIFTMGLITILLAVLIYLIKLWKVSAILWSGLSIGNGVLFFVTGFGVIDPIALVGISLIITGLQAAILTLFPTIPRRWGTYIWIPVSGGITLLTAYFAQISHFDIFLTIFLTGLICLLSLYPLILFEIDKKLIYKIIGYGGCLLLPLFTGFLLFNTLAITIIEDIARAWISTSISMIVLGFILLALHRFQVLKREYWFISWTILSASIAALFSWFGYYIFNIIDNVINLTLTLLIFEIILIPASHRFWKILGEAIIITISGLLGFLVNIYFGIAVGLIFSAIFLEVQKPLEKILRKIQEPLLAVGLFFLLFWGFQIFIIVLYALLISLYIVLFYPFIRCIMIKQWLSATLFWIGLIMVPAAVGVWFALDFFLEIEILHSTLLGLCILFSLGLVLPAFHKVSKKTTAILWIALGGSISLFLYSPFLSVLSELLPTVVLLIILFTFFVLALPIFDLPQKIFLRSIIALSFEANCLMVIYIYIFTGDIFLTTLYFLLIESILLIGIAFWRKKWTILMLFWYLISIVFGFLYGYYAYLNLGLLTWTEYMIGLGIVGLLIIVPVFFSEFSINERFISHLIFTSALTICLPYFSSITFVGETSYIYIISFACFFLSSLLLIFYRLADNLIQSESFLDRFYKSSFWILLGMLNISASILIFWCFFIGLSFSFELSLIISITLSYIFFLTSSKFRASMEEYLPYLYVILPMLCAGIVFVGLYFVAPFLNFFLILYFSVLVAFIAYWGLIEGEAIRWRIHEYLWAVSPIPLVIYLGNIINTYLIDLALAISSGVLIYATLLLLLFIFTLENKRYLDYCWGILAVSLTFTLHFGIIQLARIVYSLPGDIYLILFLSLTIGLGVAITRAFWQKYNKLVKIIYFPLTIIASLVVYFGLMNISGFNAINAFLIALFVWGNLFVIFAFLPSIKWHIFKYLWIIIASCFSFIGFYLIWLSSLAWLPSLMIGSIIFSILWIKPPLAPSDFSYNMYFFSIIIIAANISLSWIIIVLLEMSIIVGILVPLLIGNLSILALALGNIINKKYWKQIYLFIPFIVAILSLFIFYTYDVIDIYLNTVTPILIGLVLTFPLMVEYAPLRFLTRNTKILVVSIAGVMAVVTFCILGYVPFIQGQSLLKGLIAAVVVIIIIYSILPKAYEFTEFTYLYLSIGLAAGFSIIYLFFVGEAELWKKLIVIFILSAGAACLGSYKIVEKKAEQNPQLSKWRLVLLVGGFIMIVVLTILLFAFHVAV
ncbi:MAG: hypothetical protein HWN66_01275 [Candidatus Helarchaeota archaeon]|nr:hypothetical protein [Candidatus Helarchaeota archaeon]